MSKLHNQVLADVLERGAASLRAARLESRYADALEIHARRVNEPCQLAVVGRMKAGKSTFINALLGADVAKIGVTETTATINYIKHGTPSDPARPVRCYWRGGRYEDVTPDFLNSLQGNDADSLRRAEGIDHLEYLLPNSFLESVTLVDTPGTSAVVDEHQNRTAEFLNLQHQLRDRHSEETQRLGSEADAVIYLVGQVPRATDKVLLDEFGQATGGRSRALNAIGVMAKIDLQPEILQRRMELAGKIAEQLKDSLNTVVPVSAGIRRALDQLLSNNRKGLVRLLTAIRRIPAQRLQKLLDSEEFFLELEFADCPVSPEERKELLGKMDWGVFTTIARIAANQTLGGPLVVRQLEELSGFGPLKEVLERHFFKRARFLRCFRILSDARNILNEVRYKHLPEFRKRDQADKTQRDRFVSFIRAAQGDRALAGELEEFVSRQLDVAGRADGLQTVIKDLDRKFAALYHEMEEHNADFEALGQLETHASLFPASELEELQRLLGLYGMEAEKRMPPGQATKEYAVARQQAWNDIRLRAREPIRRAVAERAETRYGLLLRELMETAQS